MFINQISVFVENKSGRLADITETLGKANVDIRALSVADTTDFGILRLIVDKPDTACMVLKDKGLTVSLTKVIAISVDDTPGSFAKAMRVLADNGMDVEYMYAFITREDGRAYVILRVDDNERALEIFKNNSIEIVTSDRIYNI